MLVMIVAVIVIVAVTVIVRMAVVMRVTVAVIVMMLVLVVGVLHARRHRYFRYRLRIEQSAEQQHQQCAAQRE